VKNLRKREFEVIVVMTDSATKMIPPADFEKVSGNKVFTTLFPAGFHYQQVLKKQEVEHIGVADKADLFVVAPATANVCAKIAHGIADDFLTTAILATQAPVLVCPSMNVHMWENPVVQENIHLIQKRAIRILHPDSGALACGYNGVGRLASIEKIEAEIMHMLAYSKRLKGKKIIVTSGGTSEPIDAVRMITNKSSGKMGVALAEACFAQGADVLLFRSLNSVDTNYPMKKETYETGEDLKYLVIKYVRSYDCIIHNAAVSDFVPAESFSKKIDSRKPFTLRLETTVKILSQIKKWNPRIKLVGFKAVYKETEKNLLKKGMEKLAQSTADYIIVNDVGRKGVGFGVDDNEVSILSPKGCVKKIEKASKKIIAEHIINTIF
jgi:phosphopantothenoylcysteine decarboxylase/phosphopantothenate--cysteine ligase